MGKVSIAKVTWSLAFIFCLDFRKCRGLFPQSTMNTKDALKCFDIMNPSYTTFIFAALWLCLYIVPFIIRVRI